MKIIRATHLGLCFGVRDAIELALGQTEPSTILGDLVHNETVLQQLRAQGVRIEHQVADISTRRVIITAHGASDRRLAEVRAQGFDVVEATCPLVRAAHRSVRELVGAGYHPVIIGRRDHIEVRGMTEDLAAYDVVENEQDVKALSFRPRFGVAAQTTQPIDRVRALVQQIRDYFPSSEIRFIDTVCQPTKLRQDAAVELAQRCDLVIVIGGANSNNTRELVATCRRYCERVYHIQTAADLHGTWLAGAETIGLTAGTSTPDVVIEEVGRWLDEFAQFQRRLTNSVSSPGGSRLAEPVDGKSR